MRKERQDETLVCGPPIGSGPLRPALNCQKPQAVRESLRNMRSSPDTLDSVIPTAVAQSHAQLGLPVTGVRSPRTIVSWNNSWHSSFSLLQDTNLCTYKVVRQSLKFNQKKYFTGGKLINYLDKGSISLERKSGPNSLAASEKKYHHHGFSKFLLDPKSPLSKCPFLHS